MYNYTLQMQYFVVFFDDFCNLIPENWMDLESNNVFWLPKHIKFNKQKMHLLQPDDDWLIYECHKRLGHFGTFLSRHIINIYKILPYYINHKLKLIFFAESLQIANQIEEYCMNVSTSEDTVRERYQSK